MGLWVGKVKYSHMVNTKLLSEHQLYLFSYSIDNKIRRALNIQISTISTIFLRYYNENKFIGIQRQKNIVWGFQITVFLNMDVNLTLVLY